MIALARVERNSQMGTQPRNIPTTTGLKLLPSDEDVRNASSEGDSNELVIRGLNKQYNETKHP